MTLMIGCSAWKIKPRLPPLKWHDDLLHTKEPLNTSFPILFLGNTHDPVTPLRSAIKMSQRFARAGLVEVQVEGHCTLAAVSLCAIKKIREYLDKGHVPAPPRLDQDFSLDGPLSGVWEKCAPDERPWKPFGSDAVQGLDVEEHDALEAWREVQANSDEVLMHGVPPMKVRFPQGCKHRF
jgi:hypothetical protein